ncbi:MAG TPA: carbohydrate kinase family protein [Anaerolineales bacterium]
MRRAGFRQGPVLVLGAAGIDIVGRASADLQTGTSNPGQLRISHGGVARNVAENLAHLGTDTILLTAVGDDALGHQILARAEGEGVDIASAIIQPDQQTGAYLALLDRKGNLVQGLDDMSVIAAITPEAVHQRGALFRQASVLVMDANLPEAAFQSAFELAAAEDLPVAVDPTTRALSPRIRPHLSSLWLVSANEREAQALLPGTEIDSDPANAVTAARQLVALGAEMAMITLAEFGVAYAATEGSGHIPAVKTDIVDPTGAGDALLATVVFGLLNDIPLDEAVRLGVTAAALTLRTRDSVVPDLSLERLYDQLV